MGAIIGYRDRVIFTSNGEWEEAMEDAIAAAKTEELSEEEREYVERFENEIKCLFPGYCPFFERLFPSDEEKLFWRKAWISAAQKIVSGDLPGNPNRDPARRVFINYWCGNVLGFLLKGSEVDVRLIPRRSLTSQDAAIADGEDLLFELEWERRLEEIDQRGIMPVGISKDGHARCPYCKKHFSVRNASEWNGRRHISCLTRLNPKSIAEMKSEAANKRMESNG